MPSHTRAQHGCVATFDQSARVLEMLAKVDKVLVERGEPKAEVVRTAGELRGVAADSEQLARTLSDPASALFHMG
ncbi:hypothetical protein AAGT00_00970 (plasmid) [Streptomyces cavourensis]